MKFLAVSVNLSETKKCEFLDCKKSGKTTPNVGDSGIGLVLLSDFLCCLCFTLLDSVDI